MEINKTEWDQADKHFNSWLSGTGIETGSQQTDILKSTFLTFREQFRKKFEDLCNRSFECVKEALTEKPEEIPGSIAREAEEIYPGRIRFRKAQLSQEGKNERIINALISGDQEALNDLYEEELPKVVRLVIDNHGTIENAKDIFQDALVIILEKVRYNVLDLSCSLSTYLYAICRNLWHETLRRKGKELVFRDNDFNLDGAGFMIELENRPDMFEQVNKIILSLGDTCRQLLERYYYLNESWDKIAKSLGYINAASARNQKYKCLERIRKEICINSKL